MFAIWDYYIDPPIHGLFFQEIKKAVTIIFAAFFDQSFTVLSHLSFASLILTNKETVTLSNETLLGKVSEKPMSAKLAKFNGE